MEEGKKRKEEKPPGKDYFWMKVVLVTIVIVWISLFAGSWVGKKIADEKITQERRSSSSIAAEQKPKTWKTIVSTDDSQAVMSGKTGDEINIPDFRNIDDPIPGLDDQSIKNAADAIPVPVQEPPGTAQETQTTPEPPPLPTEQNTTQKADGSVQTVPAAASEPSPSASSSVPEPPKTQTAEPSVSPTASQSPKAQENGGAAGNYELQMGSFANQENADKMAAELKQKGHSVRVEKVKDGDREYFKVKTDNLGDQESAREQADKLKKDGFDAIIISN